MNIVREKRTGGNMPLDRRILVPWAQKIRIELLCVTPPDLFDNPAARRSGIIRANRLYSDHTSNSVEADTSTSRTRAAANSDLFDGNNDDAWEAIIEYKLLLDKKCELDRDLIIAVETGHGWSDSSGRHVWSGQALPPE
ncbi:Uncharacterized protein DBV15_04111 [Temnothorax longispinosus]|uniref:Uncharacterized protein n=1 Tax=Temnothorax longispinosus TaxID=300112 RepID=A0A4S2KC98_9HYME|nr:Uncharacterized protein DBV15_04111 [Temnothorax longispinosus]